jgi:hypothetical protein
VDQGHELVECMSITSTPVEQQLRRTSIAIWNASTPAVLAS